MNYFSNFIICMMPLILQTLAAIKSSKTQARNIVLGGVYVPDPDSDAINFDSFDCPCGCYTRNDTDPQAHQYVKADVRCDRFPPFTANQIGKHAFNCPCGCDVRLPSDLHILVLINAIACKISQIGSVDGLFLNCPCGCTGTTSQGSYYRFYPTIYCPN